MMTQFRFLSSKPPSLSSRSPQDTHQELMPPFTVLKHKLSNIGDSQINSQRLNTPGGICHVLMVQFISSL